MTPEVEKQQGSSAQRPKDWSEAWSFWRLHAGTNWASLWLNQITIMFIYLMLSGLVLSLWLSWLMCVRTTSSLCVCAPGWLWRPSSVLPRWCQLPVWGDQLGRRVRPLGETWSLHQSVELPGLDPLNHPPQEHSFLSEDHSLCKTWQYIVFGVLIIYEMPLKNWNYIIYCEAFLLTEYTFTEAFSVFF